MKLSKLFKKTIYVEHCFLDKIRYEDHGYQIDDTIELTFYVPDYFKECNDDPDYKKKNIRRFVKRKDVWDDEAAYVDVYLENIHTGNSGWLLRSSDELKDGKKLDTENYIDEHYGSYTYGVRYFGLRSFDVYKTGPYEIYIYHISQSSNLVIVISDPCKKFNKKDLKYIFNFEDVWGFEKRNRDEMIENEIKNGVEFNPPRDSRDYRDEAAKYRNRLSSERTRGKGSYVDDDFDLD